MFKSFILKISSFCLCYILLSSIFVVLSSATATDIIQEAQNYESFENYLQDTYGDENVCVVTSGKNNKKTYTDGEITAIVVSCIGTIVLIEFAILAYDKTYPTHIGHKNQNKEKRKKGKR